MKIETSTWTRLGTAQKAGIIVAAVVVPVAGVLAVIGAIGGDSSAPAATPERQPAAAATAVASASAPAPAAGKSPGVRKRTITETEPIAFKSRTVKDNWLPKGTREPRTAGIDGVRTKTYEVTLVDGRETKRKLLKSEVTREPVPEVVAIGTNTGPDDNANG
ncbi:G5 domain-containing protein [Actinoplanes sp. NPDC048967]|uniref:G5 domain-containing protein n=1 Tax=Actinoplanes sp. NPDC048967 TaxID=3155269 RepID=UPI003401BEEC